MPEPTPPTPPTTPPVVPPAVPPADSQKSVAELVFDVSERASSLIREEIELAKTEVSEKVGKHPARLRGRGRRRRLRLPRPDPGHGGGRLAAQRRSLRRNAWAGFFVEAAIFLLIAAGAGYVAYRALQAGAPPVPEQAIEEAKKTKAMLERRRVSSAVSRLDRPPHGSRSAATSTCSARTSAARSKRCAPGHRTDRLAPPGREHQRELIVGAAAVGFLIGGADGAAAGAAARASSAPTSRRCRRRAGRGRRGRRARRRSRRRRPARSRRSRGSLRSESRRSHGPGCTGRPSRRGPTRGAGARSRAAARSSGRGCGPARPG